MRLHTILRESVRRCDLDLSDSTVLTEAASGAFVVTPVLAALAGAKQVYALTRPSAHGSVEEIVAATATLAKAVNVDGRIEILTEKKPDRIAEADIITNSGHVRPIDAAMIGAMKPTAVIPLMYEAWEFRPSDIDLAACRKRQIPVAGTNETHPRIGVFPYLGSLAVDLLFNAEIPVYRSKILLLCNNRFDLFIKKSLLHCGAEVDLFKTFPEKPANKRYDALLIAMPPKSSPVIGPEETDQIACNFPDATVVQFLGDIDREALKKKNIPYWPPGAPPAGPQGAFISNIGPEPVVYLQTGGLKVGQIMAIIRKKYSGPEGCRRAVEAAAASGYGQVLPEGGGM
jgi:hypothetical protein